MGIEERWKKEGDPGAVAIPGARGSAAASAVRKRRRGGPDREEEDGRRRRPGGRGVGWLWVDEGGVEVGHWGVGVEVGRQGWGGGGAPRWWVMVRRR